EDRARAAELPRRLAERPRGQETGRRHVARREDEVRVTREGAMLEAVVEDDRVEPEARAREPRGLDPTLAGHDRAGEAMGEHDRLVSALRRRDERLPALADHDHAATSLAVAPGD